MPSFSPERVPFGRSLIRLGFCPGVDACTGLLPFFAFHMAMYTFEKKKRTSSGCLFLSVSRIASYFDHSGVFALFMPQFAKLTRFGIDSYSSTSFGISVCSLFFFLYYSGLIKWPNVVLFSANSYVILWKHCTCKKKSRDCCNVVFSCLWNNKNNNNSFIS